MTGWSSWWPAARSPASSRRSARPPIREALLATGDYELAPPTDHGPDPITAVHELELLDLVEHVWADAIADGRDPSRPLLPDTFLLRGYDGGDGAWSSCRRGATTGSARTASTPPRRSSPARLRRGARRGRYRAHRRRPRAGGRAARVRAVPAAGASRRAQPHRRLLLLQQRRHRGRVARRPRRVAGRDPRRRLPPRQRHAADLLGARRRAVRQPARRPGRRLSVLLRLRDRARRRMPARARRSTCPSRPGPMATPTWRPWTRGSTRSAPSSPMRRSSSRSASTPTTPTRSATSRCGPMTTPASAPPLRGLGIPVVALQEGGYAVDALGANAVAFLGRPARGLTTIGTLYPAISGMSPFPRGLVPMDRLEFRREGRASRARERRPSTDDFGISQRPDRLMPIPRPSISVRVAAPSPRSRIHTVPRVPRRILTA